MTITKNDIIKFTKISKKGIHFKIGDFQVVYSLNINDGYKTICEFSFTLKNKMNACFFVSQNKITKNGEQTVYPMKLIKNDNGNFVFECYMTFDELNDDNQSWLKLKTDVLVFYVQ